MNWRDHIVSDEDVLLGKPTIKGTRLTVEHLLGLLAQGWPEQQILDNYPKLFRADLTAIFLFMQESIGDGLIITSVRKRAS